MFQIQTSRLVLRDVVIEDAPFIHRMAREPAITRHQSWLMLGSEEEVRRWVENVVFNNTQQPRQAYNLLIEETDTNRMIGWIGWGHSDAPTYGEYSFGYALLPEFWGRGYMTEALQAGLAFMFETLGARGITDYCESSNVASRRVMEKAGMRLVARWAEEREAGGTVEYLRFAVQKPEWSAQQQDDRDPRYVNLECIPATFRPSTVHPVRWLDVEQDYDLARAIWFEPLLPESWRQFRQEGYRYCAVIEEGRILSLAAAWSYSDTAWEVAAVHTLLKVRRRGYGKSVVSFVTAHILQSGRLATCLTEAGNLPMQQTAKSVGFYVAPRNDRADWSG